MSEYEGRKLGTEYNGVDFALEFPGIEFHAPAQGLIFQPVSDKKYYADEFYLKGDSSEAITEAMKTKLRELLEKNAKGHNPVRSIIVSTRGINSKDSVADRQKKLWWDIVSITLT